MKQAAAAAIAGSLLALSSQVPDAESCLVTAGEGVPTSAVILRR